MVKTGDRVRVVDNKITRMMHEAMPEYYPEPGSLGTVDTLTPTNNIYWVKWDNLQDDRPWAFPGRGLEVVEEELPNITANVIHSNASTDDGRNFLMGYFKAALVDELADTQETDDGTK